MTTDPARRGAALMPSDAISQTANLWFPLAGHVRWHARPGQRAWPRLQQQWQQIGTGKTEWRDVPTVYGDDE